MANIAMVVSNRYDPDPRVQKEAASLVSAGHRVRVYAFDRMAEKLSSAETIDGVEIVRVAFRARYPYGDLLATARGMRRFLGAVRQRLREQPADVVHCHDQDTCPVGLAVRREQRSRGKRCHFVYDAHDFYWSFLLMAGRAALWRRAGAAVLKLRERAYARQADLLLTVSEGIGGHPGTAELYRDWGLAPVVLLNAPRKVERLAPLPSVFTVGYVGTVREPEMFRWLVSAIELMPKELRPRVRVCGAGTAAREVAAFLEAAATRLDFSLQVSGGFTMDDLPALVEQSSLQFCVYPRASGNIDRALPVKMLDAVAHGRPVIGNADTLMADWIATKRWGWTVHEADARGLADVLLTARRALADRMELGDWISPPTWEQQAAKLRDAYERLLVT